MLPLGNQLTAPITARIEHNDYANRYEAIRDRRSRSINRSQSCRYQLLLVVYGQYYADTGRLRREAEGRSGRPTLSPTLQGH